MKCRRRLFLSVNNNKMSSFGDKSEEMDNSSPNKAGLDNANNYG
ncbi:hypothetical protein HMPREF0765_4139 [Sphingobacterium spiritivorum ATCC 33300]|uniref:Uncharacterized protein n=1 Tax=Sphingobacterium spiritivorum ATCC 33300 TaxID=525372 RepID=C2G3I3_SPHSI|nr:hypothetical protein [Sphingobacterium spiritivorum]EEI90188.1 hypothetical protein HMPREF0765_4139 [Sphingobacterium spiritivorum ATCC 33300]